MQANQATDLLFEISHPGRRCHRLPSSDVPAVPTETLLPSESLAAGPPPLPEIAEIDLIRHFVNLSKRNMSIDTNFYPLGSCTMKYNPKRHERLAAFPGLANLHPLQTDASCQGMLLQALLCLKALRQRDATLLRMLARPGLRRSLASGFARKLR